MVNSNHLYAREDSLDPGHDASHQDASNRCHRGGYDSHGKRGRGRGRESRWRGGRNRGHDASNRQDEIRLSNDSISAAVSGNLVRGKPHGSEGRQRSPGRHSHGRTQPEKRNSKDKVAEYSVPTPVAIDMTSATNAPVAANSTKKLPISSIGRALRNARPSAFLRLPAELRWEIYEYLFGTYRVEIIRRKDKIPNNPNRSYYRLYHRQLRPRNTVTQAPPCRAARFAPSPLPTALVYTCRKTYSDVLGLLYSRTQFIFNSTRAVTRFLKVTNKVAQSAVGHVELNNHHMYNEPRLTAFRVYKHRSDFSWYLACEGMSEAFTSLKILHVSMTIRDWPIHLGLDERWSYPLMVFGGKNLDYADVKLHMIMFDEERLDAISREIEKEMMKPTAYQIKEERRMAKKLMGPLKATKSLKIIF